MASKSSGIPQENSSDLHQSVVYLALGSNIRPRKKYMIGSLIALFENFPNRFRVSEIYATRPYMELAQPGYFNCCVSFETIDSPFKVLSFTQQLEIQLGRERNDAKWQSRTIDIDILFFGSQLIDHPTLTVPHYDISNRDFFLIPMLELHESFVNPRTQKPLAMELHEIPGRLRTQPKRIHTRQPCALNRDNF